MKSKRAKKQSKSKARVTKPKRRVAKKAAELVIAAPKKAARRIGAKWKPYEKLLLNLRDHVLDGINFLTSDNLKRSGRDASGDLSAYSTHMADAGTDNFDREFALSLVSSEQEALLEIEEALKRLEAGAYGICEMCGKPIKKARLKAIPFARFCVNCQVIVEKERRRPQTTMPAFSESAEAIAGESGEGEEEEDKEKEKEKE